MPRSYSFEETTSTTSTASTASTDLNNDIFSDPIADTHTHRKGFLIVIEGIDRAGKTTLGDKLSKVFGCKYGKSYFHFPTFTKPKDMGSEEFQKMCVDNMLSYSSDISQLLAKGETVVLDRYSDSHRAYASALGHKVMKGFLEPDLVIFLDVAAVIASSRRDYGNDSLEKYQIQYEVRRQYLRLFKNKPNVLVFRDQCCLGLKLRAEFGLEL